MHNKITGTIGKSLLCLVLVLSCSSLLRAQDDAEKNYKAKCAGCHGPDGSGATPAGKALAIHDLRSPDIQKETDAEMTEIITSGKNKMPKYGDKMKPAEIKSLVAYVRDLGKKK